MSIELPQNETKLIYKEGELSQLGVWDHYDELRAELYRADERTDCILIQGSAFVVNGRAFPILGVGGIDFLDSLARNDQVDGVIGNGNSLFVEADFSHIYTAHTKGELTKCYEWETGEPTDKFLDSAPMGSLIFLLRSVPDSSEYERIKAQKEVIFEEDGTFASVPVPFNSRRWKNELRGKFLGTTRVVHCARRPTLEAKECLFDSKEQVTETINQFRGYFALVYTTWSQVMCDAVGMGNTRKLAAPGFNNPTDRITPHLLQMAQKSL